MRRRLLPLAITAFVVGIACSAHAGGPSSSAPKARPKVTLDRLDLSLAPAAAAEEGYLRDVLAREARKADWGAQRGSHIEYRFRLDDLEVTEERGLLRVTCSASGWLPKSRRAKSHLSFGGAPKDRQQLVHHVLEIVASGVVTRLAEMERRRRDAR
jgi:hypothetical protein